ncbi:hypothetical protein CROQUDRAFT_49201, partial [Cronartium quercuum f. sp. fusiforme G11]
ITVISCYNPPSDFRGIPALKNWLETFYNRHTPLLLMIDANLHHRSSTKCLTHMCRSASFKVISSKGILIHYSEGSSPTVIDLVWANWTLTKYVQRCDVFPENFGFDHQETVTTLEFLSISPPTFHNNASLSKLNHLVFCDYIQKKLNKITFLYESCQDIKITTNKISQIILKSFYAQGQNSQTHLNCHKNWWDLEKLNLILKL